MTVFFDLNKEKWVAQVGGFTEHPKKRTRFAESEHGALLAEHQLKAERDQLKAAANQAKRSEKLESLTTDVDEFSLAYWIDLTTRTTWRNAARTMPLNAMVVAKRTDPRTDIRQINLQWLEEYVRLSRETHRIKDQTIVCHLDALYVVLKQAHRREVIDKVPLRPEGLERSQKSEFVPEEAWIEALLLAFEKQNFAVGKHGRTIQLFCKFLKLTGVRTTEALQLKWSDVAFNSMDIAFKHKPKEGQQIKNKKTHILPIWSELEQLLLELKRLNPQQPFPITYSLWWEHFTEAKRSVVESLGLPESVLTEWTGHRFRALSCSQKADQGWDAFAIMDFHNHSDLAMSQRYVTQSAKRRERVRNLLETQTQQVASATRPAATP